MTKDIPEQVTIPLGNLQRSTLKALMDKAPPGYQLDELLELVFMKGLATMVRGRELPGISEEEILEAAMTDLPSGARSLSNSPRVSHDYLGFFIEAHHDQALQELAARHPFVDEDELCRIVFSAGVRALPDDDVAQRCLTAAVWIKPDGSNR